MPWGWHFFSTTRRNYVTRFGFDEKEFALLRDEIERFVMMKESWSPQELELQTCVCHLNLVRSCGAIVEHARLYSLEATKPAQLGDGNDVGVHLPQYGRQGLTASTSFTTLWRNNNDVEAFEEKLGVGEILEDRAAVAEQLGFDPERVATASSLMAAVVSTVISAPRLLL
ncbi:hypothetical protein JG688_00007974 [Phytophthora aleatoria]|uniref:Uncharacterized protein n=1 Tax=Phytophthora aleatoria TaxID=2496075 RepID=A0A8J5J901_9STRA|nr:hypothetical protein JG688_00007974 [Phytophthora aleatoria]